MTGSCECIDGSFDSILTEFNCFQSHSCEFTTEQDGIVLRLLDTDGILNIGILIVKKEKTGIFVFFPEDCSTDFSGENKGEDDTGTGEILELEAEIEEEATSASR